MTKAPKPPKPTRAELQRQVMELTAQLASSCAWADRSLADIKPESFTASAVILTITALGGREVVKPVAIRDGLSPETIAAIRKDLARSYDLAVLAKPKAVS